MLTKWYEFARFMNRIYPSLNRAPMSAWLDVGNFSTICLSRCAIPVYIAQLCFPSFPLFLFISCVLCLHPLWRLTFCHVIFEGFPLIIPDSQLNPSILAALRPFHIVTPINVCLSSNSDLTVSNTNWTRRTLRGIHEIASCFNLLFLDLMFLILPLYQKGLKAHESRWHAIISVKRKPKMRRKDRTWRWGRINLKPLYRYVQKIQGSNFRSIFIGFVK